MSLGRRLSSIRLRNPFRRSSKAPKSNRGNARGTVIEDREVPPEPDCPGNEDESHYRPLRNGPKKKSACFCCEKPFTKMEKFLSLGKRKCAMCHRKICKTCASTGGCHVCGVKRSLDLDPQSLMQVEVKDLVAILNSLHFADVNFINWPKEYLIKQLFTRLEVRDDWDPAEARTYPVRTEEKSANENRDLNDEENTRCTSEPNCKEKCNEGEGSEKKLETDEKATCSGKCVDDNPEEVPESSKLEQVKRKQLQDPASQHVDDMPNEDLCKICMDFPVNCILLNCGHLVVCIYCSDFLQECPVCRESIVRVIQTKIS